MKISRSTEYGMIAAGYIAQQDGSTLIRAEQISKEYGISFEYLLKILQQLVKANVLKSKRGPRGGFSLARPATKITILEIIEAVDGPIVKPMYLAEQTGNKPFGRKFERICYDVAEKTKVSFAKAKLSDVI